jgi:uncharacterized membrane protein
VALHNLFKQLFSIRSASAFIGLGLSERTLWEALLLAGALAAWRVDRRRTALLLSGAALAHLGAYSLVLHNPLWAAQDVGSLPLLNLLPVVYGLPLAWLWWAARAAPEPSARFTGPRALLQMALITLLGYSLLRQAAVGEILSVPGLSAPEDIARSILAVALAIGFLLWGIVRGGREWRIASLVLMLGAAAKVFLLDASGLEGLMRIASFVALGVSFIGIGWLYSRFLGGERPSAAPAV